MGGLQVLSWYQLHASKIRECECVLRADIHRRILGTHSLAQPPGTPVLLINPWDAQFANRVQHVPKNIPQNTLQNTIKTYENILHCNDADYVLGVSHPEINPRNDIKHPTWHLPN